MRDTAPQSLKCVRQCKQCLAGPGPTRSPFQKLTPERSTKFQKQHVSLQSLGSVNLKVKPQHNICLRNKQALGKVSRFSFAFVQMSRRCQFQSWHTHNDGACGPSFISDPKYKMTTSMYTWRYHKCQDLKALISHLVGRAQLPSCTCLSRAPTA